YDSAPGACCLGVEEAKEATPPRITDALGEAVVLDHVGRLQVLMIDRVVGANEGEGRLMVKVRALALHLQMRPGEQLHRFATASAAFLAATHPALGGLECSLSLAIPARMKDALTTGQGGEGFQPQVYAGLLS